MMIHSSSSPPGNVTNLFQRANKTTKSETPDCHEMRKWNSWLSRDEEVKLLTVTRWWSETPDCHEMRKWNRTLHHIFGTFSECVLVPYRTVDPFLTWRKFQNSLCTANLEPRVILTPFQRYGLWEDSGFNCAYLDCRYGHTVCYASGRRKDLKLRKITTHRN